MYVRYYDDAVCQLHIMQYIYNFLPSKSSLIIMQTLITKITCFFGYTFDLVCL